MNHLEQRIRGEYYEMPGLRLTVEQAARLWDIEIDVCRTVLDSLVDVQVLHRTHDGAYVAHPPAARRGPATRQAV